MADNSDATKDGTFQKVVGYFLRTPPKPHEPRSRRGKKEDSDNAEVGTDER